MASFCCARTSTLAPGTFVFSGPLKDAEMSSLCQPCTNGIVSRTVVPSRCPLPAAESHTFHPMDTLAALPTEEYRGAPTPRRSNTCPHPRNIRPALPTEAKTSALPQQQTNMSTRPTGKRTVSPTGEQPDVLPPRHASTSTCPRDTHCVSPTGRRGGQQTST